jgi:uncharacterized protein (DUF952 family)
MIYHVTTKQDWEKAQQEGYYEAGSLATEGFIHCSRQEQILGVLERYYKGQDDLLLLHLDETKLSAPMKYELAPSVNEEFPHVFGKIDLDAVVQVTTVATDL